MYARMHGVDAELLDQAAVRRMLPFLDFEGARFPIQGGLLQRRGGHRAARRRGMEGCAAASDRGVDVIQNCEVTGFLARRRSRSPASRPRRGDIRPEGGHCVVAGNTLDSRPAWRPCVCRSRSHVLQAFVSEAIKPFVILRGHFLAPGTFISVSRIKAAWCSAATSMATTPMRSGVICPWSRMCAKAAWR